MAQRRNGGEAMGRQGGVWAAFLAVCFVVVGLAGGFALYAAPVPLQRALARGAVLDQALLAGESPAQIVRERAAVRDEAEREEAAVVARIRLTLLVVTVMAGLFGVVVMGLSRRS